MICDYPNLSFIKSSVSRATPLRNAGRPMRVSTEDQGTAAQVASTERGRMRAHLSRDVSLGCAAHIVLKWRLSCSTV